MRHKSQKDENFPVAFFLFPKEKRALINAYYQFARMADDIADNPNLSSEQKLNELNNLEEILLGKDYSSPKFAMAKKLRDAFLEHNLSFSLATDLLIAFRQDATGFTYQTWGQLCQYCTYSAAPVGRFLLALNDESPSTYLPAASLCAALQIVNHLQDIKYDASVLKRIYLPQDIMTEYNISQDMLSSPSVSAELRRCVDALIEKTYGLLKDSEILPYIAKSRALKIELFVIFYLTKSMLYKLKKKDFLANNLKLSASDRLWAVVKGVIRGLFAPTKTLNSKGL